MARVVPPHAMVRAAVADLRAMPSDDAELVDQVHHMEWTRVLGRRGDWAYVQAEDHYFGWVRSDSLTELSGTPAGRLVGPPLAPIYGAPDTTSPIVGHLPVGTALPSQQFPVVEGPWVGLNAWLGADRERELVGSSVYTGYVSLDDAVSTADLPYRPPTADDLIATAQAFLGVPYLWGGTTALGLDCSGYVQQVYRLNGIRLDRDAHQQAMEGRAVEVPGAGDLIFFGKDAVTHVALATGERTFLSAPEAGRKVERGELPAAGRNVRAVRRYLP